MYVAELGVLLRAGRSIYVAELGVSQRAGRPTTYLVGPETLGSWALAFVSVSFYMFGIMMTSDWPPVGSLFGLLFHLQVGFQKR